MTASLVRRVSASRLNLRSGPSRNYAAITSLPRGQVVARLDQVDRDGWWFVFADVPGDGAYIGFAASQFLPSLAGEETKGRPLGEEDQSDEGHSSPPREPELDVDSQPQLQPSDWIDGWNPAIPRELRHASTNFSERRAGQIERVVVHITGVDDLDKVKRSFLNGSASAHYLIEPNGLLHQFVSEDKRAWHSGIQRYVRELYDRNDGAWRKYKRYFPWFSGTKHYPSGSLFYDTKLRKLPDENGAALVGRKDHSEWPDYQYFDALWGRRALPLGYRSGNKDPNDRTIGIEVLSYGSSYASPEHYSNSMYLTLSALIEDICERHRIPRSRTFVCGHEDVNPVERWGWDPNRGFDWDRVLGHGTTA